MYIQCVYFCVSLYVSFNQIMRELKLLPLQAGETVEQKVMEFRGRDDLVGLVLNK